MPDWEALSAVEQLRGIRAESQPVPAAMALRLQQLLVLATALMALTAQAGIHAGR
jgi:hypothetical protein